MDTGLRARRPRFDPMYDEPHVINKDIEVTAGETVEIGFVFPVK